MPKLTQKQSRKKHSNVVDFPKKSPIRRAMFVICSHLPGIHPQEMEGGWFIFTDDEGQNLFMMIQCQEVA